MSNSFERINYILRPNKQVERKMIVDILSRLNLDIPLIDYTYVGMGSIYYYDFILIHKFFGIRSMYSIDNKSTVKRFIFNKPYEFITFINNTTSKYLITHNYKLNCIFWMDYDGGFSDNRSVLDDIAILGKNCQKNSFYIVTFRCDEPTSIEEKQEFLTKFGQFISSDKNDIKNTAGANFPILIQDILLNMLATHGEYNTNKFVKCFSFIYQDGALMYTLGGMFTDDPGSFKSKYSSVDFINTTLDNITQIKVPNITYKEKFYLDSNIDTIEAFLQKALQDSEDAGETREQFMGKVRSNLASTLEIELSFSDVTNYIKNYRFIPQYYEGFI
ncbi:MAG: hypothetical protein JWQ30_1976 [Sediminibacterium sp.]|nr:hypothetical protein [Sediminibacterium sp.]